MTKVFWNWTKIAQDSYSISDEEIDLYLEVSKKQNNLWWKNLPALINNFKTHKQYLSQKAKDYFSQIPNEDITTSSAKTCPAIGNPILNQSLLLKTPCDIALTIRADGEWFWEISATDGLNISSHSTDQFYSSKDNPFDNFINFKIELPIVISTKQNYIFLHPQYHKQDYPLTVLNGVMHSKNLHRPKLNINTIIKIPKEQTTYIIKEGTVLCYLMFSDKVQLVKDENLKEKFKKYLYERN